MISGENAPREYWKGTLGVAQNVRVYSCPFGTFRLWDEMDRDLLPTRRKARAIMAILVAARGAQVPRGRIAGLLWDKVPEDQALTSLRQDLHALNNKLRDNELDLIQVENNVLSVPADRVLVQPGLPDDDAVESDNPEIYRVPLYEDLSDLTTSFDQWIREERAAFSNRLRGFYERRLAEAQRASSGGQAEAEAIVEAARALLAFDQTHERAWQALIGALVDLGDRGQAFREYDNCVEALATLLDAEPDPRTRALIDGCPAPVSDPAATLVPVSAPLASVLPPASQPLLRRNADRGTSVLILPFTHDRENRGAQFLSLGVLEGTINILSSLGELFVIGRGTAIALGARPALEPRAAAAEMGARYVVTGSILTMEGRHRIYVELVEAETGSVLRSEIINAAEAQIFDIHDQVAHQTATAIAPSIRANELARLRHDPGRDLSAYEHLLSALDLMYRLEKATFNEAGNHLQRAMQLDPGFAAVRAYAATWHNFRVGQGWSPDSRVDGKAAETLAQEALRYDPRNSTALAITGQTKGFALRDLTQARGFLDSAVQNGPSNGYAWSLRSATNSWAGLGTHAVSDADRALQLSPLDPFSFFSQHMVSQGHYVAGDFELAALWGERSMQLNPELTSNLRILMAARVALGDEDAARELAAKVREIEPQFTIKSFVARTPLNVETRDMLAGHLRIAGLPED